MKLKLDNINSSISINLQKIQQIFSNCDSLVIRNFTGGKGTIHACIIYLDVLIDEKSLNQHIIRKINEDMRLMSKLTCESILETIYSLGTIHVMTDIEHIVSLITDAGFVVLIEGHTEAYGMLLPGYETRPIEEPKIEINVRGPRESFTEDLHKNLSMVYRKLKTPDLKSQLYVLGQKSNTKVMILYLENLVDLDILTALQHKLESIQLDFLIANTQIEELIQGSTFSPFPQLVTTERPDRVATALSRGKIGIITDGTPIALLTPSTFFEMLHPSEDLYERFYFANFLRIIRLISLFLSLFGPSLYIALTTFHLEMIPTPLMMTFISSKAGIPFPTFVEALLMETSFELLREASLRLPRAVGQSVSIVGALIIGEAAVQSGIVSRPMVIVVAMTGIASFAIPSFSTAIALRMLRFPVMLFTAYCGVFGLSLSLFILILHLCSLQSFGVPFLAVTNNGSSIRSNIMKYVLLPVRYRSNMKGKNEMTGTSHNKEGLLLEDVEQNYEKD
ncbi:spore germination protein [Paenibacillus sp. LjRoot56]|uniref:spore germination protein n=1 Tax=Paenibacillus sp. LjRoot56 TaxID=3342333 RepID=UPI003ECF62EE